MLFQQVCQDCMQAVESLGYFRSATVLRGNKFMRIFMLLLTGTSGLLQAVMSLSQPHPS